MSPQDRYEAQRSQLDPEGLIRKARQVTGLSDFGDEGFLPPMRKLLDCVARDVDFHPQGLEVFKSYVDRSLVNLLRMQQDVKLYPEILSEDVSDPIIVIGLGRSGTTKLHKMLSAPDNVQKTQFWRLWNPARFPGAASGAADPRIAAASFSELMSDDKPALDAAHHIAHTEVEEESMLYFFTFEDWAWNQITPAFSYFDWLTGRSDLPAYRRVKTILQYLQWQDGGKRDRPWILKAPGHIAHLDSLLDCYPNATLVHSHRDPRQTIASWSKFQGDLWSLQSNPVAPRIVGDWSLRSYRWAMDRYLEARTRLGLDGRILDVNYEQVRSDPMSIMKLVYQRAGRSMDWDAEQKMTTWHSANEQGRFGNHQYSLGDFGLTETMVDTAFKQYIQQFIRR